MEPLTFKDIAYIRAALECKLEDLQWTIEQDNAGTLDPPLTDDEGWDMSEASLYYDHLLGWFRQLEVQSVPLRIVPKDDGVTGKKGGTG